MAKDGETLPTIADLFAKITPSKPEPPPKELHGYWRVMGKRKAFRFALLYVKNGFSAVEAYKQLRAEQGRAWNNHGRKMAAVYANTQWVSQYVRELVQKMAATVVSDGANELENMLALNRMLIHGDICDLLEQVREFAPGPQNADGTDSWTAKIVTRLRDLSTLSKQERMMIKEVRFHRSGEVAAIKLYDRLDAQRAQVALLEIVQARGGSDTDWMSDFRTRIGEAKKKAIDFEIARGKVVMLTQQTKTA